MRDDATWYYESLRECEAFARALADDSSETDEVREHWRKRGNASKFEADELVLSGLVALRESDEDGVTVGSA